SIVEVRRRRRGRKEAKRPQDFESWGFFCWSKERFDMEIRPMKTSDWPAVKAIYEQGIATKLATFETSAPEWADWDDAYLGDHRLVAEQGGNVVGWAALLPTSRRACYAGVVENSVYVEEGSRGQGIGRKFSAQMLGNADRAGFWNGTGLVFGDN